MFASVQLIANVTKWGLIFDDVSKHHLKHLLSSAFGILIKPLYGWSNSFDDLISLLPTKALYFEILKV